MGDRVDVREFEEILVRALGEQMGGLPESLSEGAVGGAARGMAKMAKREGYRARQESRAFR